MQDLIGRGRVGTELAATSGFSEQDPRFSPARRNELAAGQNYGEIRTSLDYDRGVMLQA